VVGKAFHRNRRVKRPEIKHFLWSHGFARMLAPSSNFKLRNMQILPILPGRSIYSAGGGLRVAVTLFRLFLYYPCLLVCPFCPTDTTGNHINNHNHNHNSNLNGMSAAPNFCTSNFARRSMRARLRRNWARRPAYAGSHMVETLKAREHTNTFQGGILAA
jgi:hypothetical protein